MRDVLPPHPGRALKVVSLRALTPTALPCCCREPDLLEALHHRALVRCHRLFESYEEDEIERELDFADGPNLLALIGGPRFGTTHRQAPTVR